MVAEPAIAMHAQHFQMAADIGPADAAGMAMPAGQHRVHHHPVTLGHAGHAAADCNDIAGEFMADHPGIAGERVGTMQDMQVGAADAGALHPNHHLTRHRRRHGGGGAEFEVSRRCDGDPNHFRIP